MVFFTYTNKQIIVTTRLALSYWQKSPHFFPVKIWCPLGKTAEKNNSTARESESQRTRPDILAY